MKIVLYLSILFCLLSCTNKNEAEQKENIIWYAQPASEWMEALPVGNGRLGAMVFGDPNHERIQLNEDSMWPGGPDWGDSKGNKEDLAQIRKLLQDGKPHEADELIVEKFSYKSIVRSHQTMGDLYLDFHKEKTIEDYTRKLSLSKGVTTVTYTSEGATYTEKVFSSAIDDVLVVELSTTSANGLNLDLRLDRPLDNGHETVSISNPSVNEIAMNGMVTQFGGKKESEPFPLDYGVKFETRLKVESNSGLVEAVEGKLSMKGVKKARILIVCNTSFYQDDYESKNRETLIALEEKADLLERHIADYHQFYNRVDLDLGGHELDSIPTDVRLARIKEGGEDADLAAKLFQYGRYLLISSSRPGTNPPNLQGIWNPHIAAPWNADYHVNINLQMNYWPAEVTNLSELHQPLFDFGNRLLTRGKVTAKEQYGMNGAVIHHTSDLWATTWMRAERAYWGSWIHGGGWLAQHYWEHYRFTEDLSFLKETGYPFMKEIAEFYLDWLVKKDGEDAWISAPETSPENSYIAVDGKPAAVSQGNAMGHQIITEVFENVLEAAAILEIEDDFVGAIKRKKENLDSGIKIGEDGRILEWNEPYEEHEKGHRHMSHLYALHPGDKIKASEKGVFAAAQKTIDYRLEYGGGGTGWSRAWMINFNARLHDGISAQQNIDKFLQISTADNLFDMHPPFQIDGNFGFTAGVAETLLQSHEGFIRLLPALPTNWKDGKVAGLKARGGIEVDIEWKDSKLHKVGLLSVKDQSIKLVSAEKEFEVEMKKDTKIWLDANLK